MAAAQAWCLYPNSLLSRELCQTNPNFLTNLPAVDALVNRVYQALVDPPDEELPQKIKEISALRYELVIIDTRLSQEERNLLQEKVDELKNRLRDYEALLRERNRVIQEQNRRIQGLTARLSDSELEGKGHARENQELRARLKNNEMDAQERERIAAQLQANNEALRSQLNAQRTQMRYLMTGLQGELRRAMEELAATKKELEFRRSVQFSLAALFAVSPNPDYDIAPGFDLNLQVNHSRWLLLMLAAQFWQRDLPQGNITRLPVGSEVEWFAIGAHAALGFFLFEPSDFASLQLAGGPGYALSSIMQYDPGAASQDSVPGRELADRSGAYWVTEARLGIVIPKDFVPDLTFAIGHVIYLRDYGYRGELVQNAPGRTMWYVTLGFRGLKKLGAPKQY